MAGAALAAGGPDPDYRKQALSAGQAEWPAERRQSLAQAGFAECTLVPEQSGQRQPAALALEVEQGLLELVSDEVRCVRAAVGR